MEKEAEMPVTADQRPPWNTQQRPEDGSARSAACRAAGAPWAWQCRACEPLTIHLRCRWLLLFTQKLQIRLDERLPGAFSPLKATVGQSALCHQLLQKLVLPSRVGRRRHPSEETEATGFRKPTAWAPVTL
jgi:hypothetical protein